MSNEMRKEIEEAKDIVNRVLEKTREALKCYKSASNWGIFDIVGGGFITSLIKRSKIDKGNSICSKIQWDMTSLNKELQDIGYIGDVGISDEFVDNFFDVYFDNIFTDFKVQGELKNIIVKLEEFEAKLLKISNKLNGM